MRPAILASAAAATLLHGFLLYGLDLVRPAVPLPPSPTPVVVALVASAPPIAPAPPPPPRAREVPAPKRPAKRPTPAPKSAPQEQAASAPQSTPESAAGSAVQATATAESHGAAPPSTLPRYQSTPEPEYPAAARRERQEGVVLLAVDVGSNGRPIAVAVKKSSGFPLLDAAAVAGVRRWRFEPARAVGVPVASQVEVPVRFSLAD